MEQDYIKRYYITSNVSNTFPPEFIASRKRKFIVVRNCKVLFNKAIVGDVELHADFVKVDHYDNYFVNFVDDIKHDPCKYEYYGTYPMFNIWFTDMKGNMIIPEAFKLRLLLIY